MANILEQEKPQQMFWVHTRGLVITLPPQLTRAISCSEDVAGHLAMIANDSILRKRFPFPKDGEAYMELIDFERRSYLLSLAQDLTDAIVSVWKGINSQKEIAVLLYGSIARGLVKNTNHPQPSDIDLAVIGNFSQKERSGLLDKIKTTREKTREIILEECPNVRGGDRKDIRYAGTLVQNVSELTKNYYANARNYIGSCATPLYDPSDIWQKVETKALQVITEAPNIVKGAILGNLVQAMLTEKDNPNHQLIEALVTRSRWYPQYYFNT